MNEKQLSSLTDAEFERVFAGCVSPIACIRGVNRLLEDGRIEFDGIKVQEVRK